MNIKRMLATGLTLSALLTAAPMAAFHDQELIRPQLSADVDLITALGIMQGNANGTFDPQGTLTRGQAATILYRISTGKDSIDPSWAEDSLRRFSDVAGHWSAPYINYCAALGLLEGYTDGSFRPEARVTSAELAKMLLGAAGYDSEKQGYGSNWPMAVLADATSSDMLEDFDASFTGQVSREWAAKMLSNLVIRVNTVSYNLYTGDLVEAKETFGDARYAVKTAQGILTETQQLKLDETGSGAVLKPSKGPAMLDSTPMDYDAPAELLGHAVTVYYRDKGQGLTADARIYGMAGRADLRQETLDRLTVRDGLLHIGGARTDTKVQDMKFYRGFHKIESPLGETALRDGRSVRLLDQNGDGRFDVLMMEDLAVGTVRLYDAKNHKFQTDALGLNLSGREQFAALSVDGPLQKGDLIAVTRDFSDGSLRYRVEKLSPLRTKIGASLAGEKIRIAGRDYQGSAIAPAGFDFGAFAKGLTPTALKENTYEVYTYQGYVVQARIYQGQSASAALSDRVAYLISFRAGEQGDAFTGSTPDKVQVMFANGAVAIYDYKAPGAGVPFGQLKGKRDTVFEYQLNEDGSIGFRRPYASDDSGQAVVNTAQAPSAPTVHRDLNKSHMTLGGSKLFLNENSYFFVKAHKGGKPVYSVVKASELAVGADWKDVTMGRYTAYTKDVTGLNSLVFATLSTPAEQLPGAPAEAVTGSWFLVTEVASPVITEAGTTWAVTGLDHLGRPAELSLTSDKVGGSGRTIQPGKLYQLKTQGEERFLDAMPSVDSAASAGWSVNTLGGATPSMVLVGGELYDLKSDATLLYLTREEGKLVQAQAPERIPHTAGNRVLLHRNDRGEITDLILLLDAEGKALDITAVAGFGVR